MLPTIQKQSEFDRIFAGDIQPVLKAPPQTALVHISSFLQDWGRFLAETTLVRWEKLSVEYTDYQLNYNQVWPTGVEFNSQIAEGYCQLPVVAYAEPTRPQTQLSDYSPPNYAAARGKTLWGRPREWAQLHPLDLGQ